jgi:hypothetical protein
MAALRPESYKCIVSMSAKDINVISLMWQHQFRERAAVQNCARFELFNQDHYCLLRNVKRALSLV